MHNIVGTLLIVITCIRLPPSDKGNSKYLENILNTCDILCIQEHWLLSLEKKILENMHKDFNVSAKAVDDDDIKLNYNVTSVQYVFEIF
jgi:hypothetical protein